MARSFPLMRSTPRARALVARTTADTSSLVENEVVFVQRTGPRILTIPNDDPIPLGSETLHSLQRGRLTHELAGGRRIAGSRMMSCPDIEVDKDGSYTLKKTDDAYKEMKPITVHTLDVWTGKVGELRHDVDINGLNFYSLDESELPSYHSWNDVDAANSVQEDVVPRIDPKMFSDIGATGRKIDSILEDRKAAAAEKISNDPEEKLRNKPSILPSDEAWQEIEEFFGWLLEEERRKESPEVYRLIKDEFNDAQRLLLMPTALTSLRSQIQEENAKEYHQALKTKFASRPDNLTTKFAMLCFGLSIAPITLTNIKYAGGENDIPSKVAGDGHQDKTNRTITWSEKPLEFLDVYHDRSHGYPTIRTKKRPQNAIETNSANDPPSLAKPRMRHPDFPWKSRRIGCGYSLTKSSKLHLRGGGNNSIRRPLPGGTNRNKIKVYTEMGRFEIIATYEAFSRLITRLFQNSVIKPRYHIDILQDAPPGLTDFPEVVKTFHWTEREPFDVDDFKSHIDIKALQGKQKLRVRHCGTPQEPYQPHELNLDFVELFIEYVGVAYWYLPMNGADAIGTNQYQDTFRNAIECLLPDHRQYVVEWELMDGEKKAHKGRLVLAAEAPSTLLWNRTLELTGSSSRPGPIRVKIVVMSTRFLVPAKKTQLGNDYDASKGELMIVVPGSAHITKSPILGGHDHAEFLDRIRKAVKVRTGPRNADIRLWPSVEDYCSEDQAGRYIVIPAQSGDGDNDLLVGAGIVLTADAVVARPEFHKFKLIDVQREGDSTEWHPQRLEQVGSFNTTQAGADRYVNWYSLESFQNALLKLWPNLSMFENFAIIQSKTKDTFVIGPELTENQWRLQVFDWLDNENVKVQRNHGTSMQYKISQLKSPLGITYSAGLPAKKTIKAVQTAQTIPNETWETTEQKTTPDVEGSNLVWNEWVKKQDEAYDARVAAFTADPSIFRLGHFAGADISIFGQPFEHGISVGDMFPTVFTQVKTPREVNDLQRDNRRLENIILDRIQSCQMCSSTFAFGPTDEKSKREHLQAHIDALKETESIRKDTPKAGSDPVSSSQAISIESVEDQKNIPDRLKKAHPGKFFYCPICYKLLGKQASPCNWHRKNCKVFGHKDWLILTAAEMKSLKATSGSYEPANEPKPKRKGTADAESEAEEPRPKRQKQEAKPKKGKGR